MAKGDNMIELNDKAKEFIIALKPFCESSAFDPYIVLTHAWHESGAFEHVIGNHNYWGIKKPQTWTGIIKDIITHEFIKGVKTQVTAQFVDFPDCLEALNWYEGLIRRLYPSSYLNRQTYEPYFEGLINGKYQYATDPNYIRKLKSLYCDLKNQNILI